MVQVSQCLSHLLRRAHPPRTFIKIYLQNIQKRKFLKVILSLQPASLVNNQVQLLQLLLKYQQQQQQKQQLLQQQQLQSQTIASETNQLQQLLNQVFVPAVSTPQVTAPNTVPLTLATCTTSSPMVFSSPSSVSSHSVQSPGASDYQQLSPQMVSSPGSASSISSNPGSPQQVLAGPPSPSQAVQPQQHSPKQVLITMYNIIVRHSLLNTLDKSKMRI